MEIKELEFVSNFHLCLSSIAKLKLIRSSKVKSST